MAAGKSAQILTFFAVAELSPKRCQTTSGNGDRKRMTGKQNIQEASKSQAVAVDFQVSSYPRLKLVEGEVNDGGEHLSRGAEHVSRHAVDRYRERVDRSVSTSTARRAIRQILRAGRWRPTPRKWMRHVRKTPGLRFVYWHERPHICLLVLEGTVVTVLTRSSSFDTVTAETELAEVIPFPTTTTASDSPPLGEAA
jgi:hypothetical protein